MKVTIRETGQEVFLIRDEAVNAALAELDARRSCSHPSSELRRRPTSDGGFQVKRQCLDCGGFIGNSIKQQASHESLPLADMTLSHAHERRFRMEREDLLQKLALQQLSKKTEFIEEYNKYLATPQWQKKRSLVMKRCGGVCEGCGIQPATEVHHLTYKHVYDEFLFELVGVCRMCHDRIHSDDQSLSQGVISESEQSEYELGSECDGCRHDSGDIECCYTGNPKIIERSDEGICGLHKSLFEPLK